MLVQYNADRAQQQVTAQMFVIKLRSKKEEVFHFLTFDAKAYLCSFECLTIYF